MVKCLAALALSATASAAMPLAAEEPVRTMRVSAADLNLSSAAGRATFERRIRHAAEAVCSQPMPSLVETRIHEQRCVKAARAQVAEQIAASPSLQLASR